MHVFFYQSIDILKISGMYQIEMLNIRRTFDLNINNPSFSLLYS